MSALVGYGSSDEEEASEGRPSKIAKTESSRSTTVQGAPPSTIHQFQGPQPAQSDIKDQQHVNPTEGTPGGPSDNAADISPTTTPPSSPYTYEKQRLRELTMPRDANFDIPDSPPPPERNSAEAARLSASTKKFAHFLKLKKQGVHFNARLQDSKSLRNPSLLPKLMEFAGITQEESYVSALPERLRVRSQWREDFYVENLVRSNERREKERVVERDKVDFVPAATTIKSSSSREKNTLKTGENENRKTRG